MAIEKQSNAKRSVGMQSLVLVAVVLLIIITAWSLVTVSSTLPPPSDFVVLPNTPLTKSGVAVGFANISPLMVNSVLAFQDICLQPLGLQCQGLLSI